MAARLNDGAVTDRDETRRLLYMALVSGRTKRYNLAGTLINALRHHQNDPTDMDELIDHVVAAVDGNDDAWVRTKIDQINAALDEE